MFVLCFSAAYSASGAMDNFGTKSDNKKHMNMDMQLVSFVTYCSLKWEGLIMDSSTCMYTCIYQVVHPSLLYSAKCRMTVLYAR